MFWNFTKSDLVKSNLYISKIVYLPTTCLFHFYRNIVEKNNLIFDWKLPVQILMELWPAGPKHQIWDSCILGPRSDEGKKQNTS